MGEGQDHTSVANAHAILFIARIGSSYPRCQYSNYSHSNTCHCKWKLPD